MEAASSSAAARDEPTMSAVAPEGKSSTARRAISRRVKALGEENREKLNFDRAQAQHTQLVVVSPPASHRHIARSPNRDTFPLQSRAMIDRVLAEVDRAAGEIVEFTQDLVRIPTINPPGEAYEACARFIGERLAQFENRAHASYASPGGLIVG